MKILESILSFSCLLSLLFFFSKALSKTICSFRTNEWGLTYATRSLHKKKTNPLKITSCSQLVIFEFSKNKTFKNRKLSFTLNGGLK